MLSDVWMFFFVRMEGWFQRKSTEFDIRGYEHKSKNFNRTCSIKINVSSPLVFVLPHVRQRYFRTVLLVVLVLHLNIV